MSNLVKNFATLLSAIVFLGWSTGCLFVGTPEEEIRRAGGRIEQLDAGGSTITLVGKRIDDHHMRAVAALGSNHPEYRPVRKVDVSGSGISDVGLDTLCELTSLQSLDLHRTKVTEAAVKRFRDRVPNCQIIRD